MEDVSAACLSAAVSTSASQDWVSRSHRHRASTQVVPESRKGFTDSVDLSSLPLSMVSVINTPLSYRTKALLCGDMKRYVRGLAEGVMRHLKATDYEPAYRALEKLCSKSTSQASAVRTAAG